MRAWHGEVLQEDGPYSWAGSMCFEWSSAWVRLVFCMHILEIARRWSHVLKRRMVLGAWFVCAAAIKRNEEKLLKPPDLGGKACLG